MMFGRKNPPSPETPPSELENPYHGLRKMAMAATPELVGFTLPPGRCVYGALLDWGLERGPATVFVLEDGTASLYFSGGGGTIGSGAHEAVRSAARNFMTSFEPFISEMTPDPMGDLPPIGMTDLRALTTRGRLAVRADTEGLGNGRHVMAGVFHAGQVVITAIRRAG